MGDIKILQLSEFQKTFSVIIDIIPLMQAKEQKSQKQL